MNALRSTLALALLAAFVAAAPAAQPPPSAPKQNEKKFVAYRITRGDILSINVLGEPDLTVGQKRVESTGTINLAYIGDQRLVGLTLKEAKEQLENAYKHGRVLRNPSIDVVVDQFAPRVVRVGGLVNQQGPIELPPDSEMTIVELIFKAGGLRETANGRSVRVTRTLPDGTQKPYELDVESSMKGRQRATSGDGAFIMEPGDIVYVPEKII